MNEVRIKDFLLKQGLTLEGACGLMGNLYAESLLEPKNLQNSYESKLGYNDETYTKAVDDCSYSRTSFVNDKAGYGIAQWTFWSRKEGLYDYVKSNNRSIGDLETQLEYLMMEMAMSYPKVLDVLQSSDSIIETTKVVLEQYEKPAGDWNTILKTRSAKSMEYYAMFKDEVNDEIVQSPCECGCECDCEGKECHCVKETEKETDEEDFIKMDMIVRGKRYKGTLYRVD